MNGWGAATANEKTRAAGHWLTFSEGHVTGCFCGFQSDLDECNGYGDDVVVHLLEAGVRWRNERVIEAIQMPITPTPTSFTLGCCGARLGNEHIPDCPAVHQAQESSVEQAVILERPLRMPCSPLEPYDFGAIIPGACLVDINPDEWRPL